MIGEGRRLATRAGEQQKAEADQGQLRAARAPPGPASFPVQCPSLQGADLVSKTNFLVIKATAFIVEMLENRNVS